MGWIRLHAIAIDEARDIFCAPAELGAQLRTIAADRFARPAGASPGLLAKLGPVFRRPADAPVIRPDLPTGADVETLLAGRYVSPQRSAASWQLFDAWLQALAWGSLTEPVAADGLDDFDFELTTAGVPARYGLQDLLKTELGVALRPAPGLAAGYVRHDHAAAMAEAWRPAVLGLDPAQRPLAERVLAWLEGFPGWTAAARAASRPVPDLVAILTA